MLDLSYQQGSDDEGRTKMATEAERIASKLSPSMIHKLRNGFYGEGSSTIIAGHRSPTRKALVRRGLVHDDNRWTVLGREVARAIDPRIRTLDELHALAIAEDVIRSGRPVAYDGEGGVIVPAQRAGTCQCAPHPIFGHADTCTYVGAGRLL